MIFLLGLKDRTVKKWAHWGNMVCSFRNFHEWLAAAAAWRLPHSLNPDSPTCSLSKLFINPSSATCPPLRRVHTQQKTEAKNNADREPNPSTSVIKGARYSELRDLERENCLRRGREISRGEEGREGMYGINDFCYSSRGRKRQERRREAIWFGFQIWKPNRVIACFHKQQ